MEYVPAGVKYNEAGIDFASQNGESSWINDSFSTRDGLNNAATGKIITKAREIQIATQIILQH